MESEEKISLLKEYFCKQPQVVFAFLFGSRAKGLSAAMSDWDIGVYFEPRQNYLEWEEAGRDYPQEDKINSDLVHLLGTDNVDLIVLNRANASLADAAIKAEPLVINDRKLFLEFMLTVSSAAEDFRQTTDEYAQVYWRSRSLSAQDKEILNRRLIFLDTELKDTDEFLRLSWQEYQSSSGKRRNVERWVENLVNGSIDIAKTILASQKNPVPSSYREILELMDSLNIFPQELGRQLSKWVVLRNILAHEYLDIRWKSIEDFIKNSPPVLRSFIETVRSSLLA